MAYSSIISCYFVFIFLIDYTLQNQAPVFDPPLDSTYFFPEFNATKPGRVNKS